MRQCLILFYTYDGTPLAGLIHRMLNTVVPKVPILRGIRQQKADQAPCSITESVRRSRRFLMVAGLGSALPPTGRLAGTIHTAMDGAGAAGLFDSATKRRPGSMHTDRGVFGGDA